VASASALASSAHRFVNKPAKKLLCRDVLQAVLEDDSISHVPILILANKIDKYAAAGEDEIRNSFNLLYLTTGKVDSCMVIA